MTTLFGKPVRSIQELEFLMSARGLTDDEKADARRMYHALAQAEMRTSFGARGGGKARPSMHPVAVTVQIMNTSAGAVAEWVSAHPHYCDRVETTVVTGNQLALRKQGWADVNLFAVLLDIECHLQDIHKTWIQDERWKRYDPEKEPRFHPGHD